MVSARLIGEIFVEKGVITQQQLELALEEQRASGERLGEILVARFGVARLDVASVLAEQWAEYERLSAQEQPQARPALHLAAAEPEPESPRESPAGKRPIGEIFVERGFITENQLQDALELQRQTGKRLGEILVSTGRLSRLDLASALADQWAAFQKLRPPAEPASASARGHVLPVPEVTAPEPSAADVAAVAEARTAVHQLGARVDSLAEDARSWEPALEAAAERLRQELAELGARVDAVATAGDWRSDAAALRETVEQLAARAAEQPDVRQEWRGELAEVAESVRARLERLEQAVGSLPGGEALEGLRAELAGLRAAFDATTGQPWQGDVDSLREAVGGLSDRVEGLAGSSDEWRAALTALAARVDSLPGPDGWHEPIAALERRLEAPQRALDELGGAVAQLSERVASLEQATISAGEQDAIDALRADLAELARRHHFSLEGLAERSDRDRSRLEQLEAALRDRSRDTEQALAGVADQLGALRAALDERGEALDARIDAAGSTHAARLEHELQELRTVIAQGEQRANDRVQQAAEELRAQLASALDAAASRHELDELRGELAAHAQQTEDRAAGTRAELGGVHARLDHVEAVLAHATSWPVALEPLQTRLDEIDARLEELATSRHAAHEEELADLRAELTAKIETLADTRPGRDELEGVRARLDEVAARVETRDAQDGAATEAAEQAIRDGLADLARRLTASESAHLESGRLLRQSIEGLGLALVDADARLRGPAVDAAAAQAAGYLAFMPTPEGYRLVERDGAVPLVGQVLDDVTAGGPLRVTRLGRSPLPFDRRPCAYLERTV